MEFGFYDGGGEGHFGPDVWVARAQPLSILPTRKGGTEAGSRLGAWVAHVIESLNASTACPYFLFNGHPIS